MLKREQHASENISTKPTLFMSLCHRYFYGCIFFMAAVTINPKKKKITRCVSRNYSDKQNTWIQA